MPQKKSPQHRRNPTSDYSALFLIYCQHCSVLTFACFTADNMFKQFPSQGTLTYLSLLLNRLTFQLMFSDLLHCGYILIVTQAINSHINGDENLLQRVCMFFLQPIFTSKGHRAVKQSSFSESISTCRSPFNSQYKLTSKPTK